MLSVIDVVAGVGIGKRIRAAAERRFTLEHSDTKSFLRERYRCAETRKTRADHDCVFGRHRSIRIRHRIQPRRELSLPSAHARPTR